MSRPATRTSGRDGWQPALLGLAMLGCRQDMHNQPRAKPLAVSTFFTDGKSARELVAGTVPRGATENSPSFYSGRSAAMPAATQSGAVGESSEREPPAPPSSAAALPNPSPPADSEQLAAWRALSAAQTLDATAQLDERIYVDSFPLPLTLQVLTRGQERFDIYCAVCHDRTGGGNGMIVRKGFSRPPSLHSARLQRARLGHLFVVITNGFGAMPAYAGQVAAADRWAIVGYLRALQLSQNARLTDVPENERQALVGSPGSGGTP